MGARRGADTSRSRFLRMLRSSDPRPANLGDAIREFAQGDLLRASLTVYAATPGFTASAWAQHYEFPQSAGGLEAGGIAPNPEPPYVILLDQTCDIHKLNSPFVHVAPVYNAAGFFSERDCDRIAARAGFEYLLPLTAMGLEDALDASERARQEQPNGSRWLWVADSRVQIAVDKGVLLGRMPIPAFSEAEERLAFGDTLGRRRARPAYPYIVQDLVAPILAAARNASPDAFQGVEYRVIADSQVRPSRLELVLLTGRGGASPNAVMTALAPVLEELREATGLPCTVRDCGPAERVSAADYRASVLFDPDELTKP